MITGNFEPKVDKPLAMKGARAATAGMKAKAGGDQRALHFEAASAEDDSDNPADDPEAATGDPADLWADFYNLLYTLFAGRNHGDWSALLSNTPIASQPPADIAPVDTPMADRSPSYCIPLVVDIGSG